MDSSSSLQIPDSAFAGPSTRQYRPVSVTVQPTTTSPSHQSSSSRRQRASHTVVSPQDHSRQQIDDQPAYRDVYSHPAAVSYAAAHPRRTIPKFGPYLLLQTLGEGEFGKVKLGLHTQWGEEVAVKLIRRGNIDNSVRMSKVEREIEVLRTLKHPNIVRLYDVIETDKFIGIILEYASGGELFDHILAHRYLREKDAAKLFSQLISGVWYIHQKKIVHRDLKLENLLLDRHRNVIITDFGFANRFEHRSDDLMQTSCGSPCYAAPELVISEGLYVGSAVDIWSCGVILYAMLAGYLPFDDDPANPDGDNINLLYKYIVNTPLSFPDYISAEARDLLSMMLVPDPARRADLESIMSHSWLSSWTHMFHKSVDELERAAMEQHQLKRLAYQRQMKQAAAAAAEPNTKVSRTQSARVDALGASGQSSSSRSRREPEYLYETSVDQSVYTTASSPPSAHPTNAASHRGFNSEVVLPQDRGALENDDPFAPSSSNETPSTAIPIRVPQTISSPDGNTRPHTSQDIHPGAGPYTSEDGLTGASAISTSVKVIPVATPTKSSPESAKKKGGFRHTIQVEYGEADGPATQSPSSRIASQTSPRREAGDEVHARRSDDREARSPRERTRSHASQAAPAPDRERTPRKNSVDTQRSITKPLPAPPLSASSTMRAGRNDVRATTPVSKVGLPTVSIAAASPSPAQYTSEERSFSHVKHGTESTGGSGSSSRHRKGLSVDRLGLSKIFSPTNGELNSSNASVGANEMSKRIPSESSGISDRENGFKIAATDVNRRPSTLQAPSTASKNTSKTSLLSPSVTGDTTASGRKSRRNTLNIMVEPLSRSIKSRTKGRGVPSELSSKEKISAVSEKEKYSPPEPKSAMQPHSPAAFGAADASRRDIGGIGMGMPASTSKARRVMEWFRSKSKGSQAADFAAEDLANPSDSGTDVEKRGPTPTPDAYNARGAAAISSGTVDQTPPIQVRVTSPVHDHSVYAPGQPTRTPSTATDNSFSNRFRKTMGAVVVPVAAPAKSVLRVHHGAVDHSTITTRPPPEVMKHVRQVLEQMGIEFQVESEYKYRCIRPKKKKGTVGLGMGLGLRDASGSGNGLAAFTMHGSAASNGVDKRGLPIPSHHGNFAANTGGMLRGLLMRRQSSQTSATGPTPFEEDNSVYSKAPSDANTSMNTSMMTTEPVNYGTADTAYGDPSQDAGDEVRFSVELTRLDRLNDTFSLDIRRLKGNLRSYKFLYDTLRERANLQR